MIAGTHRPWTGWRIARWTVAATLLAIPGLAMQVPDSGWNWSVGDFMFAGVMIVGTRLLYERAAALGGWWYRAGAAVALGAAFLLVWINLAVGMIGSEDDPHNAVYFGEVLLAAATAFTARLQAAGLVRAMVATASLQLLITAVAAYRGWGAGEAPGAIPLLILNLCFAGLWIAAAALFRMETRE